MESETGPVRKAPIWKLIIVALVSMVVVWLFDALRQYIEDLEQELDYFWSGDFQDDYDYRDFDRDY